MTRSRTGGTRRSWSRAQRWTAQPGWRSTGPEIYWANHGNNSIAEANLRGDADARIPVRGPDVNKPRGVAVYGDPIYWVNQGSSEIKEVDLEGHGARTVVHRDTAKGPYGLAVTGG